MKATEIYAQTGEVIERDFTKADLEQREKDQQEDAIAEAAKQAEAETKAQAKATAEGKLAALGLTTDDLRALGL
jgi:hypothetical protein